MSNSKNPRRPFRPPQTLGLPAVPQGKAKVPLPPKAKEEQKLMKSLKLDLNGKKIDIEEGTTWVNTKSEKQYVVLGIDREFVHIQSSIDPDVKFRVKLEKFIEVYKLVEIQSNIIRPDPERYSFAKAVLYPECVESIRTGISRILKREDLERIWCISKLEPAPRTIMSFYGPPGTGKTMAAKCIATELNMPMLQADYAQIESKWVGDTGKHIKALFETARKEKAIVFLDEADSLVTTRMSMHADRQSAAVAHNNALNVFMQELDRYEGIVLMTTNFFGNYDQAILRRVAQHVHFELPDQKMRRKILVNHCPNMERAREVDWSLIAKSTVGLSGGDIFQLMVNAINLASLDPNPENWFLRNDHLLKEVEKVKLAKSRHKDDAYGKRLSIPKSSTIADDKGSTPPPAPRPITRDTTPMTKEQWESMSGDSEESLVRAIKHYLLSEQDTAFLTMNSLSIEDALNGRWNETHETGINLMFARWNARLGFKAFGMNCTIAQLKDEVQRLTGGMPVTFAPPEEPGQPS